MRLCSGGGASPWRRILGSFSARAFRSDASLAAIANASARDESLSLALYNYPSFSGTMAAAFAKLYHSRLGLPCLILPYSTLVPFRNEDFKIEGLECCYLLDFIGPSGFAASVASQCRCKVSVFDHRITPQLRVSAGEEDHPDVIFHINRDMNSCNAVYHYFSRKLASALPSHNDVIGLLDPSDAKEVEIVLDYLQDIDLNKWELADSKAFKVGRDEWRSKLNCITNPYIFDQILKVKAIDMVTFGHTTMFEREREASSLLEKAFKVRLGGGAYGECLGVRADGFSHLTNEIGAQLSIVSEGAGLRPIGAVVFSEKKKLKMCLRTTDPLTDTSEIAKAYGGGGKRHGSSFNIRMDDFNQWTSTQR